MNRVVRGGGNGRHGRSAAGVEQLGAFQRRPQAPPATQNVSRKSSEDNDKEVAGGGAKNLPCCFNKHILNRLNCQINALMFMCIECSKTHRQASLIPKFSRR